MLDGSEAPAGNARPKSACSGDGGPAALWPLLDGLRHACRLLLAVSGGPDSTALMHLAAGWAADRGVPDPAVASVDHGLRPESAAETQAVVCAARAMGLSADRLVWTGEKPSHRIAERARVARYGLLQDHARRIGASHILTAHTLDDQAETVMMRLARGSGVAGLAAMRSATDLDGITLERPLLGIPKAELVRLCHAHDWPFVEDPSNHSTASARVRWRRLAPALAAEGLTAGRLARFATRAARADLALGRAADRAAREAELPSLDGALRWRFETLAAYGDEIVVRVLGRGLIADRSVTDLRLERLESLVARLSLSSRTGTPLRRTLGGHLVVLDGAGVLSIKPETRPTGRASAQPASSRRMRQEQPFTLTDRSLGNESPASYIANRDATARGADAVETCCTSHGDGQVVLLSAGRQ